METQLVLFPNQTAARWKAPRDKGTDTSWWRTQLTAKDIRNDQKKYSPLLDLWSNLPQGTKQQHVIIADFDCTSPEQEALVEDMSLDLVQQHENCILFKSVSGNWKIGFVVEALSRPTREQAEGYLLTKLPTQLHWFDRKGLNRCYVNRTNIKFLQQVLPKATPEIVVFSLYKPQEKPQKVKRLYEAPHASLPPSLLSWARDAQRQQLLQILTATWGLLEHFNLPQKLLAAQLGCSVTHVGKMLRELRDMGVLRLTDKSFIPGQKAQTYKATSVLYKAIQRHKAANHKAERPQKPLPQVIVPGQFWQLCLSTLARFSSRDAFLAWTDTLQGITDHRRKEAERYAKSHFARRLAA